MKTRLQINELRDLNLNLINDINEKIQIDVNNIKVYDFVSEQEKIEVEVMLINKYSLNKVQFNEVRITDHRSINKRIENKFFKGHKTEITIYEVTNAITVTGSEILFHYLEIKEQRIIAGERIVYLPENGEIKLRYEIENIEDINKTKDWTEENIKFTKSLISENNKYVEEFNKLIKKSINEKLLMHFNRFKP